MAKRILTGLKPTSDQFHIGNYFGAIKPFFDLIKQSGSDTEVFLMSANMHALTNLHDSTVLRKNTLSCFKMYIALIQYYGLDVGQFMIYNPAYIPAHAQLSWILSCVTHMGFMERMHAYKDAMANGKSNELSVGTFCYPILQAADVVLYDADVVPVGQDQRQHIEFSRDIAERFNKVFGNTFKLPVVSVQEDVAVVPGIDGRKMSKSYNNFLGILDDEKTLTKKIKQITTASLSVDESKDPDTCNVFALLKLFTSSQEQDSRRSRYLAGGMSFAEVKEELVRKVISFTTKIQDIYGNLSDQEVAEIIVRGTQKAYVIATKKIEEVNEKVGFKL